MPNSLWALAGVGSTSSVKIFVSMAKGKPGAVPTSAYDSRVHLCGTAGSVLNQTGTVRTFSLSVSAAAMYIWIKGILIELFIRHTQGGVGGLV